MQLTPENLPENIQIHLKSVTETSGLPNTRESYDLIVENWLSKKEMFEAQIRALGMSETDTFTKDDPRPALLLTYSGSLITLGAVSDGKRRVEYSSIKLRSDVPNMVIIPETSLKSGIAPDSNAEFTEGKIKQTSALLKISVCREDIPLEEQETRIREAAIFLTNSFTRANRKVTALTGETPARFTMKAIIKHIAARNAITQKLAWDIVNDFMLILESGMLLGEKVPLGRMGKLFLGKRAAQKARVIRKPGTDEEITVPAKPEMLVPRMSFSKGIKEKASETDTAILEEEDVHDEDDADMIDE